MTHMMQPNLASDILQREYDKGRAAGLLEASELILKYADGRTVYVVEKVVEELREKAILLVHPEFK